MSPRACRTTFLALCLAVLACPVSSAQAGTPVIGRHRERDLKALLAPYRLGGEITRGWRLWTIRADRSLLYIGARGPNGEQAELTLTHPSLAPDGSKVSPSFSQIAVRGDDHPDGAVVLSLIRDALASNDQGAIYGEPGNDESWPRGPTSVVDRWLRDGTLLALVVLGLLLVLAVRQLREEPAWLGVGLAGVLLMGGLYRVLLAPDVAMGAWPFSRLSALGQGVFDGPLLRLASRVSGGRLLLVDVTSATTLWYAALTPLAVFVAGRRLLGDARLALGAAALMAWLPMHIRFSRSEVPFVPSLVLALVCLSLIYVVLTERSRAWRAVALVLLPYVVMHLLPLRPLNWVYALPLAAAALWLVPGETPRVARYGVAIVLLGGAAAYALLVFVPEHRGALEQDAEPLRWITWGLRVLVSPSRNVLLNPGITPPPLLLLAVAGAAALWRAGRQRALLVVLGWGALHFALLYRFGTHPTAQAVYSLPQTVPFVLLGGAGLAALLRWDRRLCCVVALYALLAPLIHLPFVRDVAFNDLREHRFARTAGARIPDGCTVLEFVGRREFAPRARFRLVGRYLERGRVRSRFLSVVASDLPSGELHADVVRLLDRPPKCLVYYEGLLCWSLKAKTQPIAPVCAKLRQRLRLTPLSRTTFRSREYDPNLARGLSPMRTHLTLTVYRAVPRRAAKRAPPR